jgi:uncharacterized protein (TIGR00255 family)
MTGYATAQSSPLALGEVGVPTVTATRVPGTPGTGATQASVRLGLEIRSVNSRFLDVSFRLPDELRQQEPALRELLQTHCRRGKLELRASLESTSGGLAAEPSDRLLQRLSLLQSRIQGWLPDVAPLRVVDVLRLSESESTSPRDWAPELMALATAAVADLLGSREREGARLAAMLQERLASLRQLAQQAMPLVPLLMEQQRLRFLDRWKEALDLAAGQPLPDAAQDRALTEAAAFAIRVDVAEELTRLNSHLDEIARLLLKGGEMGKRLDFLIQELHREANTLGSKSTVLEMTRISVDMKVLIEQMREQVQNIE